jgi:hypothetical protein
VTRRARTGFFASVFDFDVIAQQRIANRFTIRRVKLKAIWAEFFVRQNFNCCHISSVFNLHC